MNPALKTILERIEKHRRSLDTVPGEDYAVNDMLRLLDENKKLAEALAEISEGRIDGHNWESNKARETLAEVGSNS